MGDHARCAGFRSDPDCSLRICRLRFCRWCGIGPAATATPNISRKNHLPEASRLHTEGVIPTCAEQNEPSKKTTETSRCLAQRRTQRRIGFLTMISGAVQRPTRWPGSPPPRQIKRRNVLRDHRRSAGVDSQEASLTASAAMPAATAPRVRRSLRMSAVSLDSDNFRPSFVERYNSRGDDSL